MADGQVVFEISADAKPAKQAINDVTQELKKACGEAEKQTSKSSDDMTKSFTKAFNIERVKNFALKAIGYIADFGKEAVALASALEEVQNVVDVTFGEGASTIESWAKKAQSQFGLTELQAKQFTSTLGAMMKSSGLAGDQIVEMSTDLAGLAADMASFYNLDFETAFQKIRAGISGETEPLKQLGINLSVANLEAFALQQGLSKTFNEMSSGEQTMLRYQYLMQATSDAQGDFARTSDSFANAQRRVETAITSIKSNLGEIFLPVIADATTKLSDFLALMTQEKPTTILDEIADIRFDSEAKIAEIEAVAAKASGLLYSLEEINNISNLTPESNVIKTIDALTGSISGLNGATENTAIPTNIGNIAGAMNDLPTDTSAGAAIGSVTDAVNKLNMAQPVLWSALYNTLSNISGLDNLFSSDSSTNFSDLVTALSTDAPSDEKAKAWETFLDALGSNADALKSLTGEDAEGAAEWLTAVKNALDDAKLNPTDVESWTKLISVFTSGLSEENKTSYNDAIIEELLAMGNQSEYAREALAALGYESDDITKAQDRWLAICKDLVKTIPGLSSIINTQTGEVKGGTQAVKDYVDAWRSENIKQARIDMLRQEKEAIEHALNYDWELELSKKRAAYFTALRKQGVTEEVAKSLVYDEGSRTVLEGHKGFVISPDSMIGAVELSRESVDAAAALSSTENAYYQARRNNSLALEGYNIEIAQLSEELGMTVEEIEAMGEETQQTTGYMNTFQKAVNGDTAAISQLETELQRAGDALKAVADYQEQVRSETEATVRSVITGFDKIETPMMKTRQEMERLDDAIAEAKTQEDRDALNKQKNTLSGQQVSITSMTQGLNSQITYMQEYKKMLAEARALGVSEDILATLSDGTQESYDYLYAITNYGGDIEALNKAYADARSEAEGFTDALTQQKLAADDVYQDLLSTAQSAIDELAMYNPAYTNTADTMQGIIDAIGDKSDSVKTQVDNVLAQIARLSGFNLGGIGASLIRNHLWFNGGIVGAKASHANGIDNVPYDGYLAMLHQGERVQTAAEAELSRRYGYQQPGFDYGAMGGAIGANIKPGDVYLDGRIVGSIISDRQGNSYRALERSGWQG